MHPTIAMLSPSLTIRTGKSSSAIEQFAGIICLWSFLTTILWWLVFDQFQPAVIMVDPLKIFWVLTNSTYLGMSPYTVTATCLSSSRFTLYVHMFGSNILFHLFIIFIHSSPFFLRRLHAVHCQHYGSKCTRKKFDRFRTPLAPWHRSMALVCLKKRKKLQ